MLGNRNIVRCCQIRKNTWRVISQFKATVTHSSHCNHRFVCRSIVLMKQDSCVSFPGRSRNVPSTTFQSSELLIQCGFIWKETMQLVSGKVEFNACQVSLLWHNSFLVSLWTFQATLRVSELIPTTDLPLAPLAVPFMLARVPYPLWESLEPHIHFWHRMKGLLMYGPLWDLPANTY